MVSDVTSSFEPERLRPRLRRTRTREVCERQCGLDDEHRSEQRAHEHEDNEARREAHTR